MREQDFRPGTDKQDRPDDDLDRMLDVALATNASVEARPGLEERVLANLRATPLAPARTWWKWELAAAALAILILVFAWRSTRQPQSIAHHLPEPSTPKEVKLAPHTNNALKAVHGRMRRAPRTLPRPVGPKLDQFPSPHPLSEQEQILAMYISQDPEHAALIAEARMEALRQDEEEKLRLATEGK